MRYIKKVALRLSFMVCYVLVMSTFRFSLVLFGLLSLFSPHNCRADATAPDSETGRYLMQLYSANDYGGHGQNWGFAEDDRGFLYVANGDGVLEYDGATWRLVPLANRSSARSLAHDGRGTIFVGGTGELGYLALRPPGEMQYVSLMGHLPDGAELGADVWRTVAHGDGIYFQTKTHIYRWNGEVMEVWKGDHPFHFLQRVGDLMVVDVLETGLWQMDSDGLRLAPGGAGFAGTLVYGLVPLGKEGFLALTKNRGLLHCRWDTPPDGACDAFRPELEEFLAAARVYGLARLPNGHLAIGTLERGLVLLDATGKKIDCIDTESDLPDRSVLATYADSQGGLWLGLADGLARLETASPLTHWGDALGLTAAVNDTLRHRGRLYVATHRGVLALKPSPDGQRFETVPGIFGQCWSLISTAQGLLAGCERGVFEVESGQHIWEYRGHVLRMVQLSQDPNQIFLGLEVGLARLVLDAGIWRPTGVLKGLNVHSEWLAEDSNGRLWMAAMVGASVAVLEKPATDLEAVRYFGPEQGLPDAALSMFPFGESIVLTVADEVGLYTVEPDSEPRRIVPHEQLLGTLGRAPRDYLIFHQEDDGDAWIVGDRESGFLETQSDGTSLWQPTALQRLGNLRPFDVYFEEDGTHWVGGQEGLIRFASGASTDGHKTSYPAWIRRVARDDGKVLYGRQRESSQEDEIWPYGPSALRFTFAAPRFDAPEVTQYRTRLEGFDATWSAWSSEPYRDYTNLWEGNYTFRVQARDVYGVVSEEDTIAFQILPPWYRSWWALLIYAAALAGAVWFFFRLLARERAINARLREVDKLKDEFLANTSHELRTPLYGITGLAESLMEGAKGELPPEAKDNLAMVVASGRRLSRLVDDILDYSKLNKEEVQLELQSVDIGAAVDEILTFSAPLAGEKNLQLVNEIEGLPPALADDYRLQQILYNLIGNAIKFTEEGSVVVSAVAEDRQLVVHVTDSGIGVPQPEQDRIFDAFEQSDASIERSFGGTGLGLAVTRHLVERHGGTLWLVSIPGEGSTFSFSLPRALEDVSTSEPRSTRIAPVSVDGLDVRVGLERVPAAAEEVPHTGSTKPRILAVDDEAINLEVLKNYLAPESYDLVTVSSGQAALDLLMTEGFDIMLLDVMMPKLSGFEVCRMVRQTHAKETLPVIFLTAKGQDQDVIDGLELGANDYLRKPIARGELLARLQPHLDLLDVNRNLEDRVREQLQEIQVLEGILTICAQCKKIRDGEDSWQQMEAYIDDHSEAEFSHTYCPDCAEELMKDFR